MDFKSELQESLNLMNQLACSGVPAIIYHRNGITMETWDRWETPAYIFQLLRFKKVLEVRK